MISAWNTDSGVSIHAELIGREWVEMGVDLKVFTFVKEDFHGEGLTRDRDEEFVVRCMGTSLGTNFLDPRPILEGSYDVLVVQDLRMLPHEGLAKIFPVLKRKSRVIVHVLHENSLPAEPWFYQFDWDAVIYFDERQGFIRRVYERAYHIPFPCAPWRSVSRGESRRELGLPEGKKVVLVFAQRGYKPYLPALPDHVLRDTVILVLTVKGGAGDLVEARSRSPGIIVREEGVLSWEALDKYVSSSDAVILHKVMRGGRAVVSSTLFQILGLGRPVLVPRDSDYFTQLGDEVLKYGDPFELAKLIESILGSKESVDPVIKAAKLYVERNSARNIALRYLEVFEELMAMKGL